MQDFPQAVEKLLKYHRHDIMNILQVISGLAQLQKNDKLFAYIRKASEEIQQFSRFIGCGDIRFALIVYEELLKEFKGTYSLYVENTVPLIAKDILQSLPLVLAAVRECLADCNCPHLKVRIQGGDISELWLVLPGRTINDSSFWRPAEKNAEKCGISTLQEKGKFCILLDKQAFPGENKADRSEQQE
jgi:hypothetical protein